MRARVCIIPDSENIECMMQPDLYRISSGKINENGLGIGADYLSVKQKEVDMNLAVVKNLTLCIDSSTWEPMSILTKHPYD